MQPDPRLLIVMNGRRIPRVMDALAALERVTVCYIQGRTESELVYTIPRVIEQFGPGLVGIISDDCVVTQDHVDRVFGLCDEIVGMPTSGWVRLDESSSIASVCRNELVDAYPVADSYELEDADWVRARPAPFEASFTGLALHVMHTDWWDEYPFDVYGAAAQGWASDYHLARRLNQNGVGILVDPKAEILHLKERWLKLDRAPEKQLYLGEQYHAIEWQHA